MKKTLLNGLLFGSLSSILCVVFICVVDLVLDGQHYITQDPTISVIDGIPFWSINLIGIVVSIIITFLVLKNKSYKYIENIGMSFAIGAVIYAIFVVLHFIIMSAIPSDIVLEYPLNSFDAIYYEIVIFPIGMLIGAILAWLIKFIWGKSNN